MSQNKEIPLSRCRSSAAVNLQQKEKGGISTILCLSCCSKEWIGLSTKYAHYPFYARGNLAIRWHDLLSIKSLYRLARVHFPDAAHQHHPVKGWPASPASLLQPRPSPRTMVHLPGGLPSAHPTNPPNPASFSSYGSSPKYTKEKGWHIFHIHGNTWAMVKMAKAALNFSSRERIFTEKFWGAQGGQSSKWKSCNMPATRDPCRSNISLKLLCCSHGNIWASLTEIDCAPWQFHYRKLPYCW